MKQNTTGSWKERKEKLKQKFPSITDEDLHYYDGKETIMIERLANKLGKTSAELRYIIHAVT
ncbi:MAG: general stress protein CsbD [Bacteroidales bacterium]|nr:general stress protein CsbD [Bacteroidales bacterium]